MSIRMGKWASVNHGSSLRIHQESKFSLKHSNIMTLALLGMASLSWLVTVGASALSLF